MNVLIKYFLMPILLVGSFLSKGCSDPGNTPVITLPEQEVYDNTDPYEINENLGAGVNLGNALEAPNEGDWGMVIREKYIQKIADAGFESVRVPIRWNAHTGTNTPFTIDQSFIERVDQVLDWVLERDMLAIINIHHFNELMENPQSEKDRFLAIWKQLSEHYSDYSTDLVFEILNEPHSNLTPSLWNRYLEEALEVIRKTNPNRVVMVGTSPWGGFDGLHDLEIPEWDKQIILTLHFYEPFHFTHQGAEWVDGSEPWLGTEWNGTSSQKEHIDRRFDEAEAWSEDENRPIHIGEFGAYSKAPHNSRVRWTDYVRTAAESRGFSWAYWEFGAGFGVYDRQQNKWRPELLNALIDSTRE
jgi:endoglucanase